MKKLETVGKIPSASMSLYGARKGQKKSILFHYFSPSFSKISTVHQIFV